MEDILDIITRIIASVTTRFGERGRDTTDAPALADGRIGNGSGEREGMSGSSRIENGMADQLGDLREESVTSASSSVHPIGIPIIHSRNLGFIRPGPPRVAIATGRLGEWSPCGFGFLPSFQSRACGVGSVPACCVSYPRKTVRRSPLPPLSASDALGVGRFLRFNSPGRHLLRSMSKSPLFSASFATGVGNDPNPVALVRGAEGLRWNAIPFSVKPALGQVPKNSAQPISEQRCHVLHDCVLRSNHANGAHQFPVESRTLSGKAGALASVRHVLAGESSDNDISIREFHLRYIAKIRHVRPMFRENARAEEIVFAEGYGFKTASPLQPETETANAAEQIEDFQHPPLPQEDSPAHGECTPGSELGLSPSAEETDADTPCVTGDRRPGDLLETRAVMGNGSVIAATPDRCAIIGRIGELAPMTPALRAEKAPRADVRTGQEQGPDRLLFDGGGPIRNERQQCDAMCRFGQTEGEAPGRPGAPRLAHDHLSIDPMLQIATGEQDREIDPGMIMQRAIVVRAKEVMQIDVEETVARDDPPTFQVWRLQAADHDIWSAVHA